MFDEILKCFTALICGEKAFDCGVIGLRVVSADKDFVSVNREREKELWDLQTVVHVKWWPK